MKRKDLLIGKIERGQNGMEDTVYVQKKNLFDVQQDPLFMRIVEETTFERVETVSYFDRRFRKENYITRICM